MPGPTESVLDSRYGAFIIQGVSILAASRDVGNRPNLCRACGCQVLEDRRVELFVNSGRAQQLLETVNISRTVAAVFSDPPTHRTIQLKGDDAETAAFDSRHRALLDAYADAFSATLVGLGYSESMARELVMTDPREVSVVRFTPTQIFDQTPGPGAGEPMSAH